MVISKLYDIFLKHPIVCHDSRAVVPGCIYWAIRGERFDGNTFAAQAFEKGAAWAVVDNKDFIVNDRCFYVEDSLIALQQLATMHRRKLGIKVIAIAGSNGKTTTKELMKRVLSQKMNTFATPGNYNNHIGLPLSILQIKPEHKAAILELGANHRGENAFLCEIAEPDAGIVTNIGKDHLEGFGGIDGVESANMELFEYLKRHGGTAMLNIDDERIVRNSNGMKSISFGVGTGADIRGSIVARFPFIAAEVKDQVRDTEYRIDSHLFGSVNLYNILAACALGSLFETDPWQVKNAVEGYIPENNRSQILKIGTNTIILDAYNANPSSMAPAVSDFAEYPAEHKMLILGDMYELGDDSAAEHKRMLEHIRYDAFDAVAVTGSHFCEFKGQFPALFFENTQALKEWYANRNFDNTVFYIKGSRGMALETILNH